jgi:fatty acid amide hydrolase 2
MPAAFCGVYAHKPTTGLLPLTGHYPVYAHGADATLARRAPYVTIGPLTRSAHDLMPLLHVMAGPDGIDPNAERIESRDTAAVDWRDRRVVLLEAPRITFARSAADEVQQCARAACALLELRGARVQRARADVFRRAGDAWFGALQSVGGIPFSELVAGGQRLRLLRELPLAALGRSSYSWPALFFCLGEALGRRGAAKLQDALGELERVTAEFARMVGDDGVLIMPVHPRPAPRHNAPVLHPFDFLYTAIFNALRVPVTVAPFGRAHNGLPLSVQIAAARGNDHITIAAAQVIEDHTGTWEPANVA